MQPAAAVYNTNFGEFILPYEGVRSARSLAAVLMPFFVST